VPRAKLISDELLELRQLVRHSDSIELKVTVPEQSQRSASKVLGIDPLQAQIRQVHFFDTPDLALNEAGVVARARRIQGRDHDSVIKLRPVVPDELPADLRANPRLRRRAARYGLRSEVCYRATSFARSAHSARRRPA
jgi:hypothetical protein